MPTARKYRLVLVIDDNPIEHFVLENLFYGNHIAEQYLSFECAAKAIEYLAACNSANELLPDLVLVDINMPDVNGFEFLEAFEKLDQSILSHVNVIIISSTVSDEEVHRALSHKCVQAFVEKPVTAEKLAVCLL